MTGIVQGRHWVNHIRRAPRSGNRAELFDIEGGIIGTIQLGENETRSRKAVIGKCAYLDRVGH